MSRDDAVNAGTRPWVLADGVELADVAPGTRVVLDDDTTHHLTRVLRVRPGATVELTDGRGVHAPAVVRTDGGVELAGELVRVPPPTPTVEVVQALPKGRKLDEVWRTCTELGADVLTPVTCARSPVDVEGKEARRLARWQAVVASAVSQSRRAWAPTVTLPRPVEQVLVTSGPGGAGAEDVVAVLAHVGATTPLHEVLEGRGAPPARVVLAVGPESGWSDAEVADAEAAGWVAARLGAPVLRTEHAAPALVAVAAYALRR
ncbi:MAG: RsmE family RNA methyltransferase [Actinomycetes bacterium]